MTAESLSIPAESLLRHRAFVRALARSLVRDEHAAEDLVQETWLTALRHPPRLEAALPAWLARVVRTRAQNAVRGEARRAAREVAAAREEAFEPEEGLRESLAMQQRVVAAVLDLKEPYRSVVLLRYYEGLSPSAIAERRGAPAGTIRAQLSRAHDLLRERLDADFGGSRAAWSALLFEIARPPVVLSLSLKTAVAIGSVIATVAAGFLLFAPHASLGSNSPTIPSTSGIDAKIRDDLLGHASDLPPSARVEIESAHKVPGGTSGLPVVAALPWTIDGTVLTSDGQAAVRAKVGLFSPPAHGAPPALEAQTETNAEGGFHFALASGAERILSVVHPGSRPPSVNVKFDGRNALDLGTLRLARGASLAGTVIDASTGAGLGAAAIYATSRNGSYERCGPGELAWHDGEFLLVSVQSTSDEDGRFAFHGLKEGSYSLQVSPPQMRCGLPEVAGWLFDVDAPADDLRLGFSAPRLSFRVTSMGRAVPRASVTIQSIGGDSTARDWTCIAEDDGCVVILVPQDRTWEAEVGAVGLVSRHFTLQGPGAGGVLQQDVELEPGPAPGRLEIEIAGSADHPVGTISLGFFETDSTADHPLFTRDAVVRSKSGAFEIADLPAKRYRVDLRVTKQWGLYYETFYLPLDFEVDVRSGETTRFEKAIQLGGRVRVRVRNAAGDSLPSRVTLKDSAGAPISVMFVQFDPLANMSYMGYWQPHVTRAHPERFVDVQPAFAEGSYSVEVDQDGFQRRSEVFHIDAGGITDLDFTLDPARH